MKNTFSHWTVLIIILTGYTGYDCYEHIARENQMFGEYPFRWILFSYSSQAILIAISFYISKLLQKLFPEILASAIGIAIATLSHVTIIGPLLDQVIWFGTLTFPSQLIPPAVFTGIYLVYRLIYLLTFRMLHKTNRK